MKSKLIRSIFLIAVVSTFLIGSSGAYFSDTVVVTGNQFSTGTWQTGSARMVISEIYYEGNKEWIELYNAGNALADIKGWSICDSSNACGTLNPAQKTEVSAGGFVVVAHDNGDLNGWTIPSTAEKINYAGGKIDFDDSGDGVVLKDTGNIIIDQMSYGFDMTAFIPSCPLVANNHSLARNPVGLDTNTKNDFIDRTTPTPGS